MALVTLYRASARAAVPLLSRLLAKRAQRGKEQPERLTERRGIASAARPDGPLIWVHGASIGEAKAALPVIGQLCRAGRHVLVTTGTVSSAKVMADLLPEGAFHQFMPLDHPTWTARFLGHWRPDAVLWMEQDFWPNVLGQLRAQRIPTYLLNARMSADTHRQWRRAAPLVRPMLRGFRIVFAQDAVMATRLKGLGARDVRDLGNLKFSAEPPSADGHRLLSIRRAIGDRLVWAAVSTHAPEEAQLVTVARNRFGTMTLKPLMILLPRHPERGDHLKAELTGMGMRVAQLSKRQLPGPLTDVLIADQLGQVGLAAGLADIVTMGGALIPHGGQNPIEPAMLGKPLVLGPHMENFSIVVDKLVQAGGAVQVADAEGVLEQITRLMVERRRRHQMGLAAKTVAEEERGAAERILSALGEDCPVLDLTFATAVDGAVEGEPGTDAQAAAP